MFSLQYAGHQQNYMVFSVATGRETCANVYVTTSPLTQALALVYESYRVNPRGLLSCARLGNIKPISHLLPGSKSLEKSV